MTEHDGCKGCRYELQDEHLEPCFHCDGTKQGDRYTRMTNADRIRSMSDEELAEFLCNIHEPDLETIVIDNKDFFAEEEIEEWLQSEAEVGR